MKTKVFAGIVLLSMFSIAMIFNSCKPKEQSMKQTNGFKEINIPCASEGMSDDNYFRADASGESQNMQASREKALLNAKSRLASMINTKIKAVNDRYMSETTVGKTSDYEEKFEGLTREVVNEKLSGIKKICEKTGQTNDGKFQTFIAIEIKKEDLLKGMGDKLTNNQKLKVDYDKMKYEKIFNEEMKKLEEEQNK